MGVAYSLLRVLLLLMSPMELWCSWLWRTLINMFSWGSPTGSSISNKSKKDGLDNKARKEWNNFDTGYDSTWEDDNGITESEGGDGNDENTAESQGNSTWWTQRDRAERNEYAAKDMQNFRHMLRNVDEKTVVNIEKRQKKLPNLLFYQNKKRSEPDGMLIENFHYEWFGDYKKLEYTHSYIQWLFPIQEKGMNWESYVLTEEEIMLFRKDEKVKKRLVESYKLMLDFYGIQLLDEKTGKVCRIKGKWKARFENLNRNTHNCLRITRILKCLGILGFQHYQAPLVKFFLHQTLVKDRLPRVKQSVLDYFLFSVVDKEQRKKLIKYAFQSFQESTGEEFVWCPKRIKKRFLREIKDKNREDSDFDISEPEPELSADEMNKGASFCINVTDRTVGAHTQQDASGFSNNDQKKWTSDQELEDDDSQTKKSKNGDCKNKANDLSAVSGGTDASSLTDDDMSGKNSAKDQINLEDEVSENQKIDYVKVKATEDINRTGDGALAQNMPPNRGDEGKPSETMPVQHGGTDTTHLDDSKDSKDDALRPDVESSNPDDEDKTGDLQGVKKTRSSEEDSVMMSEDQTVQKSLDTEEEEGRTGDDALALGTSSGEHAEDSAMELSKGDERDGGKKCPNKEDAAAMDWSETGDDTDTAQNIQLNGDDGTHSKGIQETHQKNDQGCIKNDDADANMEWSGTEGDTGPDPGQNIQPNRDDGTHSGANPVLQGGADTKHLDNNKVPAQSSAVGTNEMSDSQETHQRDDQEMHQRNNQGCIKKEPPNQDDADAADANMEWSGTEGDTGPDQGQNIQPSGDAGTHSGANPVDDNKVPAQSSAVGTNAMPDNQGCIKEHGTDTPQGAKEEIRKIAKEAEREDIVH